MNREQPSESYYHQLTRFIIAHIPIEDKQPGLLLTSLRQMHYLLNYLLLWLMISMAFTQQHATSIVWPFNAVRALSVGVFVFGHWHGLLVLNKLALLMQLSLVRDYFIWYQAPTFLFQLVGVIVWSLTKQQRILHFDSKLGLGTTLVKQSLIYLTSLLQFILGSGGSERQFLLISVAILLFLLDNNTLYYSRKTQHIFMILDETAFFLAFLGLLHSFVNITQLSFYSLSIVLFVTVSAYFLFMPVYPSDIATVTHVDELQQLRQDQLALLIIEARRYFIDNHQQGLQNFFYKMQDETELDSLIEKIEGTDTLNTSQKRKVLGRFFFQVLKNAAEHSVMLQDLLVYLYAPSPIIYCFLDLSRWQHKRQYHRMLQEEKDSCVLREAETEKERTEVKAVIFKLVEQMDQWLQQLMKERVSPSQVEEKGVRVMALIEEIQDISKLRSNQNYEIFELISEFCLECLPEKFKESLVLRQSEDRGSDLARIAFGGEQSTAGQILSVNAPVSKMTHCLPSHFSSKHLRDVLPGYFADHILNKVAEKGRNQEEIRHQNMAYIASKEGHFLLVSFAVQMSSHQTGRSWRLLLDQMHAEKALLFIDQRGKLVGCSDLASYFGFAPEMHLSLDIGFLEEMESSQLTGTRRGVKLFNESQFCFQRDMVLKIIGQIRLPELQCPIWVVELKCEEGQKGQLQMKQYTKVRTLAQSREGGKVLKGDDRRMGLPEAFSMRPSNMQFQFHYSWTGMIQTFPTPFDLEETHSHLHESRRRKIYGQDITEMRYFENRIDYKSNFEEERDCQSLQHDDEEVRGHIEAQEFHEKWDRKKERVPKWLKVVWTLVLALTAISLSAFIFMLLSFSTCKEKGKDDMWVLEKLHEKLGSVVNLASLPTVPLWDSSRNTTALMTAQLAYTNKITRQIFDHNSTIYEGNEQITDLLNNLYLHSNNYILNSSFPYSTSLQFVTTRLFPVFTAFLQATIVQHDRTLPSSILAILLTACLFALACVVGLWCVEMVLCRDRQEVVQILKSLNNDDLQLMRNHLHRYKQNWLLNGENRQIDESTGAEEDSYSTPKHLKSYSCFSCSKVWHLLWYSILVSLLIGMKANTSQLNHTGHHFQTFTHSLSRQTEHLQSAFAAMAEQNANKTLVQEYIHQAYLSQFQKQRDFRHLTSYHEISSHFINKYYDIWDGPSFCRDVDDSNCYSFLGNASQQGFEMMLSFVNLKMDGYVGMMPFSSTLFDESHIANVANISMFYMPTISRVCNGLVREELEKQMQEYEQLQKAFFVAGLLLSLSTLLFLGYYRVQQIRTRRMSDLLLVVPFEKVSKLAIFHRYYNKNYSQA